MYSLSLISHYEPPRPRRVDDTPVVVTTEPLHRRLLAALRAGYDLLRRSRPAPATVPAPGGAPRRLAPSPRL